MTDWGLVAELMFNIKFVCLRKYLLTYFMKSSQNRIKEIDFLKCILIFLVIIFHFPNVNEQYPNLNLWVYTFHMPGFLLISGYFMNINRCFRQFYQTIFWFLVPYLLLESLFIFISTIVPTHNPIDHLTVSIFLDRLCLDPKSPYWYLHTIIICGSFYYAVFHWLKASTLSKLFLLGLIYWGLSYVLIPWEMGLYFTLGLLIRQSGLSFLHVFRPSLWALPVILLLATDISTFDKGTLGGMITVYAVISLLLACYSYLPEQIHKWSYFFGKNSLILYLFSPLFVRVCRTFLPPYLTFDPTQLTFLLIAFPISVVGPISVAKALDLLHLSRWIFGKENCIAR